MQQESILISNIITVIGRVSSEFTFSHEIYGEGFYTFYIETERLSDTSDILPVTISDRIIDRESVPVGAFVKVIGQLRSYNSYIEQERKNRLILTVFARDIYVGMEEGDLNMNPNEVCLNGFICKQPVYRTTPFGREITDLLMAVNRSYNKSDYIPCITWGRNARFAGKLHIGDNIRVWGRMQSRVYQKRQENGELLEKIAYEVSVSKLEFASAMPAVEDTGDDGVYMLGGVNNES